MADPVAYFAQVPDGGFEWGNLLYLLVLIVLPVVNAIKDKFVERAQAKQDTKRATNAPRGQRLPKLRPIEPSLPQAKPFTVKPTAPPSAQQPVAPAGTVRPVVPTGTPPIARVAPRRVAPPSQAAPAPRVPPIPAPPPPARPAGPQRRRVSKPVPGQPVTEPSAVAGVAVERAAPRLDVHDAAPTVRVRGTRPQVDVRAGRPVVDVHGVVLARADEGPGAVAVGFGEMTPAELRRAVVLSEILRSPVALRGPGGWRGP